MQREDRRSFYLAVYRCGCCWSMSNLFNLWLCCNCSFSHGAGRAQCRQGCPWGLPGGWGRAVAELPSLSPQGWRTAGTCPRCARTSRRWSTTASCPPTDPPAPPPASPRRSGASTRRTRRSVTQPLNVPARAPHAAALGREPPAVGSKKH